MAKAVRKRFKIPANLKAVKKPIELKPRSSIVNTIESRLAAFIALKVMLDREGRGPGDAGRRLCPLCMSGTAHYSIASNGHLAVTCSRGDCLRMME